MMSMDAPQDVRTYKDIPHAEKGRPDGKIAKRKIGRPIIYLGNPFSPDVTLEERRVTLRRVSNRESARRMRARRDEELERAYQEADYQERSKAILCQKLNKAQACERQRQEDLAQLNRDIVAKDRENAELCTTIAHLRKLEAEPHHLQSSFKKLLPNPIGFGPCTELPVQPDTPSIIDASWLDGEWLAFLENIIKKQDFSLSPSSFSKGQDIFAAH